MKAKKSALEYGERDVISGDLDYKDAKIKVSMFLDGDVLRAVKAFAIENHQKYQTLINQTLRETFVDANIRKSMNESESLPDILRQLRKMDQRIQKLEKKKRIQIPEKKKSTA